MILDGDANGYPAEDARLAAGAGTGLCGRYLDVAFVCFGNFDIGAHDSGAAGLQVIDSCLCERYPDAAFVCFGDSGIVAHDGGAVGAAGLRAIDTWDGYLGRHGGTPSYPAERWTIVVTTDHGHAGAGGHGGSGIGQRRTFGPAAGAGIPASATPWRPGGCWTPPGCRAAARRNGAGGRQLGAGRSIRSPSRSPPPRQGRAVLGTSRRTRGAAAG
ncbi:hypothetical protein [Nonomuraea typhae]|uniref:Metalloenzyme domain-containing protein n=1 Tax=Nonomuraea typhae TaxID=2603600 RepID=A0ABW7Z8V8_9ACTN